MIKFSAGYTNLNNNFCIDNLIADKNEVSNEDLSVFSVVQNIINRGCPTKPSKFLQSKLGKINSFENPVYKVSKMPLNWIKTIKGGDRKNPALEFYEKYLIQSLNGDYRLLKSFIPECSFNDLVLTDDEKLKNHYVDFYSPKLRCAIEIDGIQHKERLNDLTDKERDAILHRNGINVVRIAVDKIKEKNSVLEKLSSEVDFDNYIENTENVVNNYNACIRFQNLILTLLKIGKITLNNTKWKFKVLNKGDFDEIALTSAVEDIISWINNIRVLQGKNEVSIQVSIEFVKIFDKSKGEELLVDLDIFDRYCDIERNDVIYIRNDYFEYLKDANVQYQKNVKDYIFAKNYYTVANGNIQYKIEIDEKQHNALLFVLKNIFSFDKFLPKQEDIIVEVLNKSCVIGILPTGAGKSLCYQVASLLLPGTTLVVSPLKILMKDQCENMIQRHMISNVCYINSSNKGSTDIIRNNQSKMVLISPERFFNEDFLTIIKSDKLQISMVTVDEVHCLSEWGHDFRTSYLCLIHYLKENLDKNCRLIGLTATASPRVCEDVEIEFSNFKGQTKIIQSDSLKRNNLNLVVKAFDFKGREYDKNSKYKELYDLYQNEQAIKEKTVVFTTTKSRSSYVTNSCYNLANKIRNDMGYQDADLTVDFFSANTDNNDDEQDINEVKLENFKSGKTNLLFSTKAFGMGIDIPDIRKTIHFSLPSSIESLYQEFGRAGRDGKQSECLIWYYKEDEKIMNNLFENKLSMKAVDNAKSKFNEFQTNLYFLTMGNLDIEEESYFIVYLYRYLTLLSERNPDVSFYANEFIVSFKEYSVKHNKKEFNPEFDYFSYIDKALYRLYLMGRITMWSVRYDSDITNPNFVNITITNIPIKEQIENVNKYIRKYELDYFYDASVNGDKGQDVLKALIDWIFNHFVYQRMQAIKNLYEYCTEYVDSNQFMTAIVNYLAHDERFGELLIDPNNYEIWFTMLKGTPLIELKSVISRYLESDDKLVSINFISGIIRLVSDDFDNPDGERRLKMAFESILKFDNVNIEKIIESAINFIGKKEHKEIFIHTALSVNSEFAEKIYKYYQNEEVEIEIIINVAEKIAKVGGKLNDKFRKNK